MRSAIVLLIFLITACQPKSSWYDGELLTENQLIDVLSELQYMEALHRESEMVFSLKSSLDSTSKIVLDAFQTDSAQVAASMEYFILKTKRYKRILDKIEKRVKEKLEE
jgi:hypothetical protein